MDPFIQRLRHHLHKRHVLSLLPEKKSFNKYILTSFPRIPNFLINGILSAFNQWEKSLKNSLNECVYVNSALKIQCHVVKNTLFSSWRIIRAKRNFCFQIGIA